MDLFILIVSIIISIIAAITGDNNRYGRYGMFRSYNISEDPLEIIRYEYSRRLENYYKNNTPRTYLKSNYCEAALVKNNEGLHLYCKEKTNGKKKGRYFVVEGEDNHVSTMWGIIDMEFHKLTTYSDVKKLYYSLNQNYETTGGLRYFYEPLFKKYPDFKEYVAQNEYCRMELKEAANNVVIICSEIWNKNPRQFVISGNKYLLQNIFYDFDKEKNKFFDYMQMLAKYSVRLDCNVKEIILEENSINTELKTELEKSQATEPIEPVQVDDEPYKQQEKEPNDIRKYNERNLDI